MLELFIALGIILLLMVMLHLIRKNNINFKFVYLNIFVLILFIAFVLMLEIPAVREFLNETGIIPRDLMLIVAIGYLFYASFIQGIIIAGQNEKLEKLATIISVESSLKKGDVHEKDSNAN